MGADGEEIKYLLDPHGNKLTSSQQQAEEFRRMWSAVYKINDNDNADFCRQTEEMVNGYLENTDLHRHYDRINLTRLHPENELTRPITTEEIMLKIRRQKSRKAPGRSKIDKEALTKLPRTIIEYLARIFNVS